MPGEGGPRCSSAGNDCASGSASLHGLLTWSLQATERQKGAQALGSRQKLTQTVHTSQHQGAPVLVGASSSGGSSFQDGEGQ